MIKSDFSVNEEKLGNIYGVVDLSTISRYVWGGKGPIPVIGEKVKIKYNDFTFGEVVAYFKENDQLGVEVVMTGERIRRRGQVEETNTRELGDYISLYKEREV